MKIIGTTEVGEGFSKSQAYVAIITHAELMQAIKAMQEAYTKFAKVAPVAARFAGLTLSIEERGAA